MSAKVAGSSGKNKKRDPDFVKAEIAMQRAAKKARERAKRIGAGVVVLEDDRIVEERPEASAG
jgi:hypothetical protein